MAENSFGTVLTAADLAAIQAAVAAIQEKFPAWIAFSSEYLASTAATSNKSQVFAEQIMEAIEQNPDFLPQSPDRAEACRDVELFLKLYSPRLLA